MRYIAVILTATLIGCGSESTDGDGNCTPGSVQECPCGGGQPDCTQTCLEDGTWGECKCGGDTDVDSDTDGDKGVWTDPVSGLMWQDPPSDSSYVYLEAVSYCESLALGGHGDWRLPDINELRSLVRDCPPIELGGSCPISDPDCLEITCQYDFMDECHFLSDVCTGDFHWDSELHGLPATYHSDSEVVAVDDEGKYTTFMLQFGQGGSPYGNSVGIWSVKMCDPALARCVRGSL